VLRRVFIFLASCLTAAAANLDASKLPPPANVEIDFTRDIKPILETSCIRCHGPERPRAKFRLDNRDDALKGGKDGVDIIPHHSEKSLLIFYVAGLVEDMEMPPTDKGKKLTEHQIALLRAWIDQGVVWEESQATNRASVLVSPAFGYTTVHGDNHKFREHYWRPDGLDGGLENFELFYQSDKQTKTTVTGHASRDDYNVELNTTRNDLGFFHTGVQQYRKWFDDTGGYFPELFATPFSLNRDLHLDIGKAYADFGLTLPNWPRMVLGYEYDFKRGEEATTSWNSTPGGAPNLGPGSKHLDESVHIVKFDLNAELSGIAIEDQFRGEFYTLNTQYTNANARGGSFENVSEGTHYFEGANSLRLEKQATDWLFASGGYFFSKLNGDASFTDAISNFRGLTVATAPRITLERESHLLNLNGLFGPFDGLTISSGVQSEWTRQTGVGTGNLNQINSTDPLTTLPVLFTQLASDYDQNAWSETLALRYTKIPFTALFAEARAQQQTIGQSDSDIQPGFVYAENPIYANQLTDFRFGFNTSPWRQVTWSAHYRRYEDDSWYEKRTVQLPIGGYPGFIKSRSLLTDEAETKLALHPTSWLKTTLTYRYQITDYNSVTPPALNPNSLAILTPGGPLLAGRDRAHVYGIGATITPTHRLFIDTTFTYQPTSTTTAHNRNIFINDYKGDIYSVLSTLTYVLTTNSDIFTSYSFSKADYGQPLNTVALPLGIQYDQHALHVGLNQKFTTNLAGKLQYAFYHYEEPGTANVNNYDAHSIFATLTLKFR
jgi:mono/diheme cytochrome c family protein